MTTFNTVHIFGFGSSQIISDTVNKQTPNSGLTSLAAFVAHVISFKPEDVTQTDYHAIHIFNDYEVRYLGTAPKVGGKPVKDSWSIKWDKLDLSIVGALIDEIASK